MSGGLPLKLVVRLLFLAAIVHIACVECGKNKKKKQKGTVPKANPKAGENTDEKAGEKTDPKAGGKADEKIAAIPTVNPYIQEAMGTLAEAAIQSAAKAEAQVEALHQRMIETPNFQQPDVTAGMKAFFDGKGDKEMTLEETPGFNGISEFLPSGYKITTRDHASEKTQPEGEKERVVVYPAGPGYAMMNGCFGRDYKKGDPCYASQREIKRCINQIDSANFIGVGFNGRGRYSPDGRRKSLIQRVCAGKATFMDRDVPDTMNIFGVYDYSVNMRSFKSAEDYMTYIREKAQTSSQESMFQAEAESMGQAVSAGGNLGFVGAVTGAVIGSAVAGPAGTAIGAKLGHAVGGTYKGSVGAGWGDSSSSKDGKETMDANAERKQRQTSGNKQSMISTLTVNVKLYEIVLDDVKPSDFNPGFFSDFLSLPTSYYEIGAALKFSDFIQRWGTHYVRSAKFGGELSIKKTAKKTSTLTADEFATMSQNELKSMVSSLKNEHNQQEASFGMLGFSSKYSRHEQKSSQNAKSKNERTLTSNAESKRNSAQNEFINTKVEAKGGDPEIATAITEFYSPGFKPLFRMWLNSIKDFPKPYDFTLGKLTDILNFNSDELFKNEDFHEACFADNVAKDANGTKYFMSEKHVTDINNVTTIQKEKHVCKWDSKAEFEDQLKRRRLALEQAIQVYMIEGAVSTSSFDIPAGEHGCETNTLEYLGKHQQSARSWPTYAQMKDSEDDFRVIMELREDLPSIRKNEEFVMKYHNERWYTRSKHGKYELYNSCQMPEEFTKRKLVCVDGLWMTYDEKYGYFRLDEPIMKKFNVTIPLNAMGVIATAKYFNVIDEIKEAKANEDKIVEVPCNVVWHNAHRIDPMKKETCIHFTVATSGDLFIVFSSVPNDHKTWLYVQITQSSVSFYKAMQLKETETKRGIGLLGNRRLFENCFVCLKQENGKNNEIMYGKTQSGKESGQVLASHVFDKTENDTYSFYTFAAGDERVAIDDARKTNDKPKDLECSGHGMVKVGNDCKTDCHSECKERHKCNNKPHDAKACSSCKNVKSATEECISECPVGEELSPDGRNCQKCPDGHVKAHRGNGACIPCSKGEYRKENANECTKCPLGRFSKHEGSGSCEKCAPGTHANETGTITCKACPDGTNSTHAGAESCDNNCKPGHFSKKKGDKCQPCDAGFYAPNAGSSGCLKCPLGEYSNTTGADKCEPCAMGTYNDEEGKRKCKSCEKGRYNDEQGKSYCKPCEAGTFANEEGQSECTKCEAGSIAENREMSECVRCKDGEFQDSKGQSSCETCAMHHYTNLTERTSSNKCAKCPKNHFTTKRGSTFCKFCPVGQYLTDVRDGGVGQGVKKCKECPYGHYNNETAQGECKKCEKGYHNNKQGQTSCKICDKGSVSEEGFPFCEECKIGFFAKDKGMSKCEKCPYNALTTKNGSSFCDSCQIGFYNDTSDGKCKLCETFKEFTSCECKDHENPEKPNEPDCFGARSRGHRACTEEEGRRCPKSCGKCSGPINLQSQDSRKKIHRTISQWYPEYEVSFDFYANTYSSGYRLLFGLKSLDAFEKAPYLPAIFTTEPDGNGNARLHICTSLDGNNNKCHNTKKLLAKKQWHHIKIKSGKHADPRWKRYTIEVNKENSWSFSNYIPRYYRGVEVYTSDLVDGYVENLKIKTTPTRVELVVKKKECWGNQKKIGKRSSVEECAKSCDRYHMFSFGTSAFNNHACGDGRTCCEGSKDNVIENANRCECWCHLETEIDRNGKRICAGFKTHEGYNLFRYKY